MTENQSCELSFKTWGQGCRKEPDRVKCERDTGDEVEVSEGLR